MLTDLKISADVIKNVAKVNGDPRHPTKRENDLGPIPQNLFAATNGIVNQLWLRLDQQ